MTDPILLGLPSGETILIAAGTGIACRVAFLANRPPIGWVLLTFSFGTAFVRAVPFLYEYFGPAASARAASYAGTVLGFPLVVFIFFGVLFLYKDFRKQLHERQKAILA